MDWCGDKWILNHKLFMAFHSTTTTNSSVKQKWQSFQCQSFINDHNTDNDLSVCQTEPGERADKKSSPPTVSPSQASPGGGESFGSKKIRSSFGRGFFKIRGGKRTASSPDLGVFWLVVRKGKNSLNVMYLHVPVHFPVWCDFLCDVMGKLQPECGRPQVQYSSVYKCRMVLLN